MGEKEIDFDELPLELFKDLMKTIKSAITYPYPAFELPEIYTLILIAGSEPRLEAEDFLSFESRPRDFLIVLILTI